MLKTTKLILFAQNSRFNQNSHVETIQTYIDKTKFEVIVYVKTENINNNLSAFEILPLRDLNSRKDIIIKKQIKTICALSCSNLITSRKENDNWIPNTILIIPISVTRSCKLNTKQIGKFGMMILEKWKVTIFILRGPI
jgi:hypothetical protein